VRGGVRRIADAPLWVLGAGLLDPGDLAHQDNDSVDPGGQEPPPVRQHNAFQRNLSAVGRSDLFRRCVPVFLSRRTDQGDRDGHHLARPSRPDDLQLVVLNLLSRGHVDRVTSGVLTAELELLQLTRLADALGEQAHQLHGQDPPGTLVVQVANIHKSPARLVEAGEHGVVVAPLVLDSLRANHGRDGQSRIQEEPEILLLARAVARHDTAQQVVRHIAQFPDHAVRDQDSERLAGLGDSQEMVPQTHASLVRVWRILLSELHQKVSQHAAEPPAAQDSLKLLST